MIEGKVRGIMSQATHRFAQKEGVQPKEISIVIHTKNVECIPQYYYMVNNKPKRDENNNIVELKFKKDILNKSFDPIGTEGLVAHFLSNKFKAYEELFADQGVRSNNLYFMIHPNSDMADDFDVFLLHQKSLLKKLTLGEISGS